MKYAIDFTRNKNNESLIEYKLINEGKVLYIPSDSRGEIYGLSLKSIRNWEPPYNEEEISIAEKQEILKNIEHNLILRGSKKDELNFNFSSESNIYTYDEIINIIKFYNSITDKKTGLKDLYEVSSSYFNHIAEEIYHRYSDLYKLSSKDILKVKQSLQINFFSFIYDFSIRALKESTQKNFTYGLCALDMVLTNDNKKEIKKFLKEYKKIATEKKMSFDEFMSKNRPLNDLIKEIM